jgi:hypothetical protein
MSFPLETITLIFLVMKMTSEIRTLTSFFFERVICMTHRVVSIVLIRSSLLPVGGARRPAQCQWQLQDHKERSDSHRLRVPGLDISLAMLTLVRNSNMKFKNDIASKQQCSFLWRGVWFLCPMIFIDSKGTELFKAFYQIQRNQFWPNNAKDNPEIEEKTKFTLS